MINWVLHMKLMKYVLIVALLVLSWGLGRYFTDENQVAEAQPAKVYATDTESLKKEMELKISHLEKEILKRKQEADPSSAPTQNNVVQIDPVTPKELPVQNEQSVIPTGFIQSSSFSTDTNKIIMLPSLFEQEPLNAEWSLRTEQFLLDQISISESFREVEVGQVQCRTTICRVEVRANGKDEKLGIASKFIPLLMANPDANASPRVMVDSSNKEGFANVYVEFSNEANKR